VNTNAIDWTNPLTWPCDTGACPEAVNLDGGGLALRDSARPDDVVVLTAEGRAALKAMFAEGVL